MNAKTIVQGLTAVAAAVLMLAAPARAGALSIGAEVVEARPGADLAVPINITDGAGMEGLQFVLTYDPAVLENTAVALAPLAGVGMADRKVREPGRIRVAMYPERTIAADGPLLIAYFTVLGGAGTETAIELADARAWEMSDAFPVEMLVTAEAGHVTVIRRAVPLWAWIVGGAVVIVLGLGFALVRHERHVHHPHGLG